MSAVANNARRSSAVAFGETRAPAHNAGWSTDPAHNAGWSTKKRKLCMAALLALLAFVLVLATLDDPGVTWDEPRSFKASRGYMAWLGILKQALFEGRVGSAFDDAVIVRWWVQDPTLELHPPVSKLAVGLGWGLFRNLWGNIPAYRLSAAVWFAVLVALVYLSVTEAYRPLAGLVASLCLLCMPRVFLHAHLANLDIPMATVWVLGMYLFWRAITHRGWAWTVIAGLAFGIALGTKLNALLMPLVWGIWLLIWQREKATLIKMVLIGATGFVVFLAIWPWLYHNTLERLAYYISMGYRFGQTAQYYLGQTGRAAWHYPLVLTIAVVPTTITVAYFAGIVRVLRPPAPAENAGWITDPAQNAGWSTDPAQNAGWSTDPAQNAGWSTDLAQNAGWNTDPAHNAGWSTEAEQNERCAASTSPGLESIDSANPANNTGRSTGNGERTQATARQPRGERGMEYRPRTERGMEYRQRYGYYILLNALVPLAIAVLGLQALYSGERHFMPAFPYLAMLAGIGFVAILEALEQRLLVHSTGAQVPTPAKSAGWSTKQWQRLLLIGLAILLFAPPVVSIIRLHPYELSYYSEMVGGLPGAVRLGLETTFWCESYKGCLPYLNANAPEGALIWVDQPLALRAYQEDRLLRQDLRITGWDVVSPYTCDYALVQMRETGFTDVPELVDLMKQHQPEFTVSVEGVPLAMVYRLR